MREDGGSAASDLLSLGAHTGTHVDALCHISRHGRLHGGIEAIEAMAGGRFDRLGVESIEPVICRGVLLDVAAALGADQLDGGRRVTAADLEETCRQQEVEIHPGDAVLVRTGWHVGRWADPEAFVGHRSGVPGPDEEAARWLAARGARITGSDTLAYEWLAPGAGLARLPVHSVLLVEHGIPIIEVMNLEEPARDGVFEFELLLAPLRLVGATGSPVRPLGLVR